MELPFYPVEYPLLWLPSQETLSLDVRWRRGYGCWDYIPTAVILIDSKRPVRVNVDFAPSRLILSTRQELKYIDYNDRVKDWCRKSDANTSRLVALN